MGYPLPSSMGTVPFSQQRLLPRVKVKMKAHFHSPKSEFETTVTSISEGGVFLYATRLDPEGTPVRLEFTTDDGARVQATGEVIYTGFQDGLRGMGIRFNRLADAHREAIARMVRARPAVGA